jgi:hypothetical protein
VSVSARENDWKTFEGTECGSVASDTFYLIYYQRKLYGNKTKHANQSIFSKMSEKT